MNYRHWKPSELGFYPYLVRCHVCSDKLQQPMLSQCSQETYLYNLWPLSMWPSQSIIEVPEANQCRTCLGTELRYIEDYTMILQLEKSA